MLGADGPSSSPVGYGIGGNVAGFDPDSLREIFLDGFSRRFSFNEACMSEPALADPDSALNGLRAVSAPR